MTVREMHIEVGQAAQLLGANRSRRLMPEEIDWLLNKNMGRFISLAVEEPPKGKGAESDAGQVDKIRDLKVPYESPLFAVSPYDLYSPLPPLYRVCLSDHSYVRQLCNQPLPALTNYTYSTNHFRFPVSAKPNAPYYTEVKVMRNTVEVFNITSYTQLIAEAAWPGLKSKPEVYLIRDLVMQRLRDRGERVFWERYDQLYYPGEMIILSDATFEVVIDGAHLVGSKDVITRLAYADSDTGVWKNNRQYTSEDAQNKRNTAFSSTYYESPVSEIVDQRLFVYTDNSFIVSRSRMMYIRKPRMINLTLGQDCELTSDGVHDKICDLTVEYIKKLLEDPNWQTKLQDNIQRTPI